jgi:predicted signal transduction protein with EAL and GGDEF domain
MAHVKNLPVHELKVDRSFVSQMTSNTSDAVIVRSTVNPGRNLGLRVVAEASKTRGPFGGSWMRLAATPSRATTSAGLLPPMS